MDYQFPSSMMDLFSRGSIITIIIVELGMNYNTMAIHILAHSKMELKMEMELIIGLPIARYTQASGMEDCRMVQVFILERIV